MLTDPAFLRRLSAANYRLPIARACGLRNGKPIHVVDATAGWGRDGLLLAALGAHVTMIERNSEQYAALQRELELALAVEQIRPVLDRLRLVHADARDWLQDTDNRRPDVIHVDPMHPTRTKSAKVKAGMADLQDRIGPDEDAADLVRVALQCAKTRVALKWPAKAELPAGLPKPTFTIPGKTVQYVGWEMAA